MRQYVIPSKEGGIDTLALVERDVPTPTFGQAVVRVRAASLNYRDLLVVKSGSPPQFPRVPLSDGAGEVVAVGEGVRRVRVGDRVAATFFQSWWGGHRSPASSATSLGGAIDGMLSEFVALDAEGLVHFPEHLSYEEASTLPCAGVTAWNALGGPVPLRSGESLLALGTGGVSIFALQFAKAQGLRVIITSSSNAKLARARDLGADEVVNYVEQPEWDAEVLKLTNGLGVSRVMEVGGAGTLPRSLKAVALGGEVTVIGGITGRGASDIGPADLISKAVTLRGIYVGSRDDFEAMNRAIALSGLRPVIDRTFAFEETREAYRYLESGRHFGKIVIAL
jgi:NADPH:quinone reductase-like Zn-dependent oxidoreductase